jgi:hypothetical protein
MDARIQMSASSQDRAAGQRRSIRDRPQHGVPRDDL